MVIVDKSAALPRTFTFCDKDGKYCPYSVTLILVKQAKDKRERHSCCLGGLTYCTFELTIFVFVFGGRQFY